MAIPTRINIDAGYTGNIANNYNGAATPYIVETPTGVNYLFYIDANQDIQYVKSLDGGMSWSSPATFKAGTNYMVSIWYDRWSGIDGDLIHILYTESGGALLYYKNINTTTDTISSEYNLFDGVSISTGGSASIARMRGGNLIVVGCIDAGVEPYAKKSTDVGVNWSDITGVYEAANDRIFMAPGWGADNQDGMAIYYDYSAQELSVKYFDDSGNSWSEASLGTSIVLPINTDSNGHISIAVDLTNSQVLVSCWSALDTANADLRFWKVTQSAQTELTNVVLNSTDDQAFSAISISPAGDWFCFYLGKSDGTEIYQSTMHIYYKKSIDGGSTWGTETRLTNTIINARQYLLYSKPFYYKSFGTLIYSANGAGISVLTYNAPLAIPHTTFQLGM